MPVLASISKLAAKRARERESVDILTQKTMIFDSQWRFKELIFLGFLSEAKQVGDYLKGHVALCRFHHALHAAHIDFTSSSSSSSPSSSSSSLWLLTHCGQSPSFTGHTLNLRTFRSFASANAFGLGGGYSVVFRGYVFVFEYACICMCIVYVYCIWVSANTLTLRYRIS